MQQHRNLYIFLLAATLIGQLVSACSTGGGPRPDTPSKAILESGDWETIKDLNQIAAIRKEVSKPSLDLSKVTILRMMDETGKRVEVTSIAPTIVGQHKGGAPAARTTFTIAPDRETLVLFGQDVPHWVAYRKNVLLSALGPGDVLRFPVVQDSGQVIAKTFTVEKVIVQ